MKRILFAGLPALALVAACDSQENATTSSESPAVAGDDGAVAAPADPMTTTAPVDGAATMDPAAPTDGMAPGEASDTGPSPTPGMAPDDAPPPANAPPPPADK